MRLTVNQKGLEKVLAHANWIVEKKQAVPILGYILFDAEVGKGLTITATNMDMTMVDTTPCDVVEGGKYCLPAGLLYDITKKLETGTDITFEFLKDTNSIEMRSRRASFSIHYIESSNFPPITDADYPVSFFMNASVLKQAIDVAKVAMLQDNSRFHLNGIHMHHDNSDGRNEMRFVATDLFRIACVSTGVPNDAREMPPVIVSKRTVTEILKLVDSSDGDVRISVSDNRISFDVVASDGISTRFGARLVNGTFPEYAAALEVTNNKILTLNTGEILEALDRVSTVVVDSTNSVKLQITADKLTVRGVSKELGSAIEEIDASFSVLEPMEICFNSKYLIEILKEIETPNVTMLLAESNSSTIIRPVATDGAPDVGMVFAVMPIEVVTNT
jgi:DNA polymerase-3 subunit beta